MLPSVDMCVAPSPRNSNPTAAKNRADERSHERGEKERHEVGHQFEEDYVDALFARHSGDFYILTLSSKTIPVRG